VAGRGVITCKGVIMHGTNIDVASVKGVTYGTMDASPKPPLLQQLMNIKKMFEFFKFFLVPKLQILLSFRIYHLLFKNCKKASVLWFSMIKVFFNVTTTMSIIDFAYALKAHSLIAQVLCSSLVACNPCGLFKTLRSL